jgi:hypothetical protein
MGIDQYLRLIENELLTNISLESIHPFDPIIVENRSTTWKIVGSGNYAAVFFHESMAEMGGEVYWNNTYHLKIVLHG